MSKTVALQSTTSKLANFLSHQGYKVIDLQTAQSPGVHADAILHTSYHPDMVTSYTSLTEPADITLGNISHEFHNHPTAIPINITGLNPDQVLSALTYRLRLKN